MPFGLGYGKPKMPVSDALLIAKVQILALKSLVFLANRTHDEAVDSTRCIDTSFVSDTIAFGRYIYEKSRHIVDCSSFDYRYDRL